jgi:F-type H+-transporting ATPase subunit a
MLAAVFENGTTELFFWKSILFKGTNYAINKTVLLCFVSAAICITIFLGGSKAKKIPSKIQNIAETLFEFIEQNISIEVIGKEGRKYTSFLASMFFFILFINIWSIIPVVQFPATARIGIPLVLSAVVWAVYIALGFKKQGPLYIFKAIFPPGVPKPLYLLIVPIEFVSKFIVRPISLAVRLFANMFAGHILLTVFIILSNEVWIAKAGWYQRFMTPLPFFGLLFMTFFELLVAVLQAYIFTMLTAVYIEDSVSLEH